jgi:hypothetical protein
MTRKREYRFKGLLIEMPISMHKWLKDTARLQNMSMSRFIMRLLGGCMLAEQNRNR